MTDERASDPRGGAARDAAHFLDSLDRAREWSPGDAGDRLPWYLLIGPDGAGKTSALLNSGLLFRQGGDRESPAFAGDPATCRQYWFAEDAMFIDSAGQQGAPGKGETDEAGLVRLLRRHRPRCPLNGAIVTLALGMLVDATSDDRRQQVRAIRARLRELDAALGLRLPVYLVIAQVDRLAGFSAFFDALPAAAREQVWGFTSPLGGDGGEVGDRSTRFASAFDALAERLDAMSPAHLHEQVDAERRAQAFGFPREFALLAPVVKALLADLVAASNLEAAPRLRGFYFTSARQGGALIDPLAAAVSARFGLGLPASGDTQSGTGSFFLKRLFTDIIVPEQNLVMIGVGNESGRRRLRQVFGAGAAAAILALALFWTLAYSDQQRLLEGAQTRLGTYSGMAKDVPVRDVADADLARTEQALDESRNIVESLSAYRWTGPFAFDQSGRLFSAQSDLYDRALDAIFLPRLLVALQQAIKTPQRTPQQQDSDAKAYLMLGGLAPMDDTFVRSAMTSLFDRLLPGAERRALRQSLNGDAVALLARPLARLVLDETSVEDAKARLATGATP